MMELSEKIRDCIGTVEEWADEAAALKRENDKAQFAIKQVLMANEEGYDAPKIWQDLRAALLTAEEQK